MGPEQRKNLAALMLSRAEAPKKGAKSKAKVKKCADCGKPMSKCDCN